MNQLLTKLSIYFLNLLSTMSFKALYRLSDFLCFFLYRIAGYRKNTILINLVNAFPEKTENDRKAIAKKFYRHLSDIIVETIRMKGMTESDFRKRFVVRNPEVLDQYFDNGQSVVVLGMHYNNWEWSSSIVLNVKHMAVGVYKPLHDNIFDNYMNTSRAKTGTILVSNSRLLRFLLKARQEQRLVCVWLAADQTPPGFYKLWMKFMNQETLFYPGAAVVAQKFNYPVFFQRVRKTGRGFYETEFELLTDSPADMDANTIMKIYIKKMEEMITLAPEFYLWSHKRWKHNRPAEIPLHD